MISIQLYYLIIINLAPDMPEDLKVEEIPNSSSLSNYDLKMSWSLPKYIPDYYQVRFASLAENSTLDFNISGVSMY